MLADVEDGKAGPRGCGPMCPHLACPSPLGHGFLGHWVAFFEGKAGGSSGDPGPATQRLGSQAPVETTEAKGLVQGWAGHGWTLPPAPGHAHIPAAVHPKPNSPALGGEAACGQVDAPDWACPQQCPPPWGDLLDAHLSTPPAAASSPNAHPQP